MKSLIRILFVLFMALIVANCSSGGDTENYSVVIGTVKDISEGPLGDVTVSINENLTVNTNSQGYFSLTKVPVNDHVVVNFTKTGYVQTTQVTATKSGDGVFLSAVMAAKASASPISATAGGTVTSNSGSVTIPANGLVTSSGSAFTGTANVSLTVFNPATPEGIATFPGEFVGVTDEGEEVPFASYGYIDITVEDGSGNVLQLADGKTANISIPIPASLWDSAEDTIPIWYFNHDDGKWHEETTGVRDGSVYTATISHFSIWNSDVGYNRAYIVGVVEDCTTHTPIACARVTAKGESPRTCWTSGETCTDSDGRFRIPVDANSTFSIFGSKGGIQSSTQTLTAPGSEATSNQVTICIDAPKITITTTWGLNPRDLDAHLTFPVGSSREHVYFSNKNASDSSVNLNTDDTDSYGPEIITVTTLHDGVYRFSIHHYAGDGTISSSGVNVDMVIAGRGIYHKSAPGGTSATKDAWSLWDITVTDGEVTNVKDLNIIKSGVSDDGDIEAFSPDE